MICKLCGGRSRHEFTSFGRLWRRCADCGSAALDTTDYPRSTRLASPVEGNDPSVAAPGEPEDTTTAGPDWQAGLDARAALVRRLAPGRRVLDIGAGHGHFVECARGLGLDAEGIETSLAARAVARSRGIELLDADLESLAPEYHAVTLWDTLAGVSDPQTVIRAARRVLVPGGVLAISTDNASGLRSWLWRSRHPQLDFSRTHQQHQISKAGVAALCDRAGLSLIRLVTRGMPDLRELVSHRNLTGTSGAFVSWLLEQSSATARPLVEALGLADTITAHARR